MQAGRTHEAEGIARDVRAESSGHAGAGALIGAAMLARGDAQGALRYLREAAALPGAPAQWLVNLRQACARLLLLNEAIAAARAALTQAPDHPELLIGLGQSLAEAGAFAEAREHLAAALKHVPDHVPTRLAYAHTLLAAGDWREGWDAYEWRLRALNLGKLPGMPWDGNPIAGQIALVSEQGFGDALQFARYIPRVAAHCDGVVVACQPALMSLMARIPGVVRCVPRVSLLPKVAAHATFGSLPRLFATTPETIPSAPYLTADPAEVAAWRARLGPGPLIGLAWAGNPGNAADGRRSLALARLRALLGSGACFVSLQKEVPERDRAERATSGMLDFTSELHDFAATAALVSCLDRVISVDSAVAHLAGALGIPTWILIMEPADWRWLRGRSDTPWYPTAKLFRQEIPGDWDAVIAAISRADPARRADHRPPD